MVTQVCRRNKEKIMTVRILLGSVLAGVMLNGVVLVAMAREVRVSLEDLPDAVRETILAQAAGDRIVEIERETRGDKTTYEAEFRRDGREMEIKVAEDGTLLGTAVDDDDDEDDLKLSDLPREAQRSLREAAHGARILGVEREREGVVVVYEASWRRNGSRFEAEVLADGTLLEIEELIALENAPAGVQAAAGEHFAGQNVIVAKKMIVVYELETRVDGKEVELYVSPTGKVLSLQDEDDDGDDDDDDDDGR
jgi:uncharacterized membrane protein YkoI